MNGKRIVCRILQQATADRNQNSQAKAFTLFVENTMGSACCLGLVF